jgi:hypothetical protein
MIPLYGAWLGGGKLHWVDGQPIVFVHVYQACFGFWKGKWTVPAFAILIWDGKKRIADAARLAGL